MPVTLVSERFPCLLFSPTSFLSLSSSSYSLPLRGAEGGGWEADWVPGCPARASPPPRNFPLSEGPPSGHTLYSSAGRSGGLPWAPMAGFWQGFGSEGAAGAPSVRGGLCEGRAALPRTGRSRFHPVPESSATATELSLSGELVAAPASERRPRCAVHTEGRRRRGGGSRVPHRAEGSPEGGQGRGSGRAGPGSQGLSQRPRRVAQHGGSSGGSPWQPLALTSVTSLGMGMGRGRVGPQAVGASGLVGPMAREGRAVRSWRLAPLWRGWGRD